MKLGSKATGMSARTDTNVGGVERHDLPGLSFLPDHHSPGHRLVLDKHHDSFGDLLWLKQNRRDRLLALFGRHLARLRLEAGVSTQPGQMQLTRTPICSFRVASEAVRRTTPALAAPYSGAS